MNARFTRTLGAVSLALAFTVVANLALGTGAVITYRKIFRGSAPEFVEIRIGESGRCSYDIRQLAEDPDPQPFVVGDELRQRIFSLAATLENFRGADLDVHRKIANLGEKTFRYENGSETYETKFNYTTNEPGSQLYQIFEGLSRQQEHVVTLARRLKHDRLGLNDELMSVQKDYEEKLIPEPAQLAPVLQQIADDSRVIEVARERARALLAKIAGAK